MELESMLMLGIILIVALLIPWWEGLLDRGRYLFAAVVLLALAFVLRGLYLEHRSGDYNTFLVHWVDYFRQNGGFRGFAESVGNYNVPYLYFLALFSHLPLNDLYLIKLLSIAFDVVLAFGVMKLVGFFTPSVPKRLAAYLGTLLLPTVIINGAIWGQCDSIYVSFAVLALWLALSKRPALSFAFMALSFGFKLQAVFLMPIYLVLLFAKKVKLYHFFVFPLTYILLILPAVLCGRPFWDTLFLYLEQTDSIGTGLNYNSPSVFALIRGDVSTAALSAVGISAAFLLVCGILVWAFLRRKNLTNEAMLGISILFAGGIPFLLPRMHDRYFFMLDVLTLVPAVLRPAYIPATAFASFASLLCYYAYFRLSYFLPLRYGSFALIAVLLIDFTFTASLLNSRRNAETLG